MNIYTSKGTVTMIFTLISGFVNNLLTSQSHNNFENTQHEFNKKIEQNLRLKTKAGHMVQSKGEMVIADYLWDHGMPYVYDSLIKIDSGEWIRPDFILPELNNLFVEFKGMNTKDYNFMFERKMRLLKSAGLMVLIIKPEDLGNLNKFFV